MADFKVGDKVILRKPQAPFPANWPADHRLPPSIYAFDKLETTWDKYHGGIYTIVSMNVYRRGYTAAQLESVFVKGSIEHHYSWPIECIFPVDTIQTQIPCDCSMNLILAQGCQKKDHY